jgi:hypothetical protein
VSGTRVWCLVDVADRQCLTRAHASSSKLRLSHFLVPFIIIINDRPFSANTGKKEHLAFEVKCISSSNPMLEPDNHIKCAVVITTDQHRVLFCFLKTFLEYL